ncbi:MAG TPA: TIGR03118 family protein, partial [Blastocatellia bacterium]|nr:TIGR03118 family protein [Blastocatellia bacterium]
APAHAQYHLTNLVSNQLDGHTPNTDPLLVNAWGLARSATSPWWVSDNLSGWATLYNATGTPQGLKVLIPTAGNGPASPTGLNGPGTPTGVVFNGSPTDFQVQGKRAAFIFAALDGTISAWAPGVNANQAFIAVDNSAGKAMYTGLAITSHSPGPNFLYAADNTNNKIDMFDGNFILLKSFGDPNIPSNFSVFGIQDINGQVYVAYAIPNVGPDGFIDVFNEDGTFVKTLVHGLPLDQAWGIALAPSNFGPLSNTLLVSNNSTDGTINGFNLQTGKFVGTIRDRHGRKIIFNNTWGVAFGGGATNNGALNELFVTVGPGNGAQSGMAGTFASIVFDPIADQDGDHDHDDGPK